MTAEQGLRLIAVPPKPNQIAPSDLVLAMINCRGCFLHAVKWVARDNSLCECPYLISLTTVTGSMTCKKSLIMGIAIESAARFADAWQHDAVKTH